MPLYTDRDIAFLDMDGVLANFVEGACALLGMKDPYREGSPNLGSWNMFNGSRFPEHVHNAWDRNFWANLPKMHDADAIVKTVSRYFGWDQIVIFSKPSTHLDCVAGKLEWLKKHYPQLSNQFLFGTNKACCANPKAILIDDSDKNVDTFLSAGGRAILLPRKWNTSFRVHNDTIPVLETLLRGYGVYPGGAVAWAAKQVRRSAQTHNTTQGTELLADNPADKENEDE